MPTTTATTTATTPTSTSIATTTTTTAAATTTTPTSTSIATTATAATPVVVVTSGTSTNKPEAPTKSIVIKDETPAIKEQKVFIGNLSFSTTKESLTSFAESAGKVLEAIIIKRGRRPIGYGFVTFETEGAVQKAIKEFDHKMLDGREINVQMARPKEINNESEHDTSHRKKRSFRRRNNNNQHRRRRRRQRAESSSTIDKKETVDQPKKDEVKRNQIEETPLDENKRSIKKKNNNRVKPERIPTEPSKTTLFVANLPYATTSEELKDQVFKNYKVVSAYIARMRNGRSKGYGFVEFENEKEQLKALELTKDLALDGRSIYLKIAFTALKKKEEEEEETNKVEVLKVNDTKK
ncbi:uncharacterized protein BX663DRAFT_557200 [Cokeromyces recurvatus]|uniref:uncharacterized protein n=1 Tax=Cokeromyces recurvatus TaxID=90255 RepID=UPI00221EAF66|nr:uncharacterized protein BX663DRAFT_557200 [Cokeromyces recurvatus]KAI7908001.1 hypothetical protein BX663DRAFT_557200 [Cokeromyces recurvatus]